MEAYCPIKNVVHVSFDTQYQCCSTFVRLQEFYESPIEGIRGKFFTLEQFMDAYSETKEHKSFSYFTDWGGFNLPCHAIDSFEDVFGRKLLEKEKQVLKLIRKTLKKNGYVSGDRFYVIGTFGGVESEEIVEHEIAHALFHLSPEYKKSVLEYIDFKICDATFGKMRKVLLDKGYCEDVVLDEIQAYLSTGTSDYVFGSGYKTHREWFTKNFNKHRNLFLVNT